MGKLRKPSTAVKATTSGSDSTFSFICDFCGQNEKGKGYLQRHFDKRHRKFDCRVCDQVYSQKANLLEHLRSHFESFFCQYCGATIYRFEQFQKHVYQKHEPNNKLLILSIQSKETYKCRFCVRTFPNPVHRNCHENGVHKGRSEAAFKCMDCNLIFLTKEDLRSHSFEHYTGSLNFCAFPDCDRFFKTAKQLRNHTNIHGPAKYECEKCHQRFFQSSNFSKHKKRCKGESKQLSKSVTKDEQEELSRVAKEQFLSLGGKLKNARKAKPAVNTTRKRQILKSGEAVEEDSAIVVEYLEEFSEEVKPALDEASKIFAERKSSRLRKPKVKICTKRKTMPSIIARVVVEEMQSTVEDDPGIFKKSRISNHESGFQESNPRFVCDVCAFQTSRKADLRVHLKMQHPRESFSCCSRKFKKKTEFNRHQRLAHNVSWKRKTLPLTSDAVCDICGSTIHTLSDLRNHMKQHMKTENCNLCHKKLQNVSKHMKEVHETDRTFVCPICSAGFKSRSNLKNHLKTHEEPSVCPICQKLLPNMERHLQWHKRPKAAPHRCPQCNKSCSTKQAVQEHIHRIHEKMPLGKSYTCPVCKLNFIRNHDLRRHAFIHYHGRIFNCDFPSCNEMFKSAFKRQCHSMVHNSTNEASFECSYCDRKYLRKTALHKHQKQAHCDIADTLSIKIIKKTIGHQLE